jgi:hypothetical protein
MLRRCAHLFYLSFRRSTPGIAIVIAMSGVPNLATAQTGGPGVYADSHNPAGPRIRLKKARYGR